MTQNLERILAAALRRMLRPLVRILLRNGVPVGVFAEHVKKVYVDVALAEFAAPGRKASLSRAALLTGLTRKEVSRLAKLPDEDDGSTTDRYNRAARVLSGWLRDPEFCDDEGNPRALVPDGADDSFVQLVRRYSGDVPARAVMDELLRVGAVTSLANGKIELAARGYVPAGGSGEKITILGTDVAELIATIDHNLVSPPEAAFFQRKVAYDNLPAEALEVLRGQARAEAQRLLERTDRAMSSLDRDNTPTSQGTGRRRAVLAIHWFEESLDETHED